VCEGVPRWGVGVCLQGMRCSVERWRRAVFNCALSPRLELRGAGPLHPAALLPHTMLPRAPALAGGPSHVLMRSLAHFSTAAAPSHAHPSCTHQACIMRPPNTQELFQTLDTDASGGVSLEELTAGLTAQGYVLTDNEIEQLVRACVDASSIRPSFKSTVFHAVLTGVLKLKPFRCVSS